MNNGLDEIRPYVEHLRIAHHRLHQAVQAAEQALSIPPSAGTGQASPRLAAELKKLELELANHFREEELGGCLEEAVSHAPGIAPEADAVLGQHTELLQELAAIIVLAEQQNATPAEIETVQRQFHQLVARLHSHEAAENRILRFGFGASATDSVADSSDFVK